MPGWKSNLIEPYRLATLPLRSWQMRQRSRRGQVPIYCLFYHRVSDSYPNPWTISRNDFRRQIEWFEQNFQIVDLQECQRRIRSGVNKMPTLSITFDDGYAENCEFAIPYLIERRIPVTYFVTTENVIEQKPFRHDVEQGQPLPVNSIESLRALDMAGVEIAAHTRTHPDLGQVSDVNQMLDEVVTSSRELEDLIGRAVRYFAFPYGQRENLNGAVFHMLKQAGFLGACTTLGGWNEVGRDEFQISRLHGDPDFNRMKNWLSFDPRMALVKPFEYQSLESYNLCPQPLPKTAVCPAKLTHESQISLRATT